MVKKDLWRGLEGCDITVPYIFRATWGLPRMEGQSSRISRYLAASNPQQLIWEWLQALIIREDGKCALT